MSQLSYETFKAMAGNDLADNLEAKTGKKIVTEEKSVEKFNTEKYESLVLRPEGESVGVSVNLTLMYEDIKNGTEYDKVIEKMSEVVLDGYLNRPKVAVDGLLDYESVKGKLFIQAVPAGKNAELLKTVPHRDIADIAFVVRIVVSSNEEGMSSTLVTNELLRNYGITPEELFKDAEAYAPEAFPAEIRDMADVLAKLMDLPEEIVEKMNDNRGAMFVASNPNNHYGAGILAYPDFLEQACDKLGGDFFLLPSSIHEVILVPDDGRVSGKELSDMVRSINEEQVAPKDRLSDVAYHYDSKTKTFEPADDFFEKENEAPEK